MASQTERFPRRLPLDQPPPRYRSLVGGRRSPLYGLAWFCSERQLSQNLGDIPTAHGEYREAISGRWKGPFSYGLSPTAVLGIDGNFYLVALWNQPHPGHTAEAIIEAARVAFGVDERVKPEWYRFPLTWVVREQNERDERALNEMLYDLDIAD